jgi:membrane-bound ClpP family serine protease
MVTEEPILYSNERGVSITATRATFRTTTYSIANITSVANHKTKPRRRPGILLAIFGVIVMYLSLVFRFGDKGIVGIVMLVLGIIIAVRAKGSYSVLITTAAGEHEAEFSRDEKYIQSIVNAINEAIFQHGRTR